MKNHETIRLAGVPAIDFINPEQISDLEVAFFIQSSFDDYLLRRGIITEAEVFESQEEYQNKLRQNGLEFIAVRSAPPYRKYEGTTVTTDEGESHDFIGPLTRHQESFGYAVIVSGEEYVGARARNSTLGHIVLLQKTAKAYLESSTNNSELAHKKMAELIKQQLVDLSNDYSGGQRYDGKLYVASKAHFNGLSAKYVGYASLSVLANRVQRAWATTIFPRASENETQKAGQNIPGLINSRKFADSFLLEALMDQASPFVKYIHNTPVRLIYPMLANVLYGGDMKKTYVNLSAVAKMTGHKLPEGWQQFIGSTTEFTRLQETLSEISSGLNGYLEAADTIYGGDMFKTYVNLSAVAKMTGHKLPEGWQQFNGSTVICRSQASFIKILDNYEMGYSKFVEEFYLGNSTKASRSNYLAVCTMATSSSFYVKK